SGPGRTSPDQRSALVRISQPLDRRHSETPIRPSPAPVERRATAGKGGLPVRLVRLCPDHFPQHLGASYLNVELCTWNPVRTSASVSPTLRYSDSPLLWPPSARRDGASSSWHFVLIPRPSHAFFIRATVPLALLAPFKENFQKRRLGAQGPFQGI